MLCLLLDTTLQTPPFYNYPQYLCLKLMRILVSCNLSFAIKLINFKLIDILENYLFNKEDIKVKTLFRVLYLNSVLTLRSSFSIQEKLIKVQIESLRILRCLFLLRVENNTLYK